MKPSKFTAMHVHITGAVILLVVALILYFGMIRPKNQDTEIQQAAADTAEKGGGTTADNSKSAADLVKSKSQTKQIEADWAVYDRKYMPDLNWDTNLLQAYYVTNKINDIPAQWGRWVTAWYDAQKRDGVTRVPGVDFPVPPLATDPNGIASLTSITLPSAKNPWKVSMICQTFDDAMAHLRRFNGMLGHGVPVVDAVTLSGHSPELMLSYNLAMYIIPKRPPPAVDPRIGSGTGGGGGAQGMMGSPMGAMGTMGVKPNMSAPAGMPGAATGTAPGAAKGSKDGSSRD